jgi:hypothetical protein
MTLIDKLIGRKKNILKASCPVTKEPIEFGFGYLLTTAQVIASKKYWDLVMTEPETLSYTLSHFKNQPSGTQMRSLIFNKYSTISKPWIVSDSCISLFEVDRQQAREAARRWWDSQGTYLPDRTGPASETLPAEAFSQLKDYAILEAGRARIQLG